MTTPLRVLLFLLAGTVVAGGGAYISGALDPYFAAKPEVAGAADAAKPTAELLSQPPADAKSDRVDPPKSEASGQEIAAVDPAAPTAEPPKPSEPSAQPPVAGEAKPASDPAVPTFDVLRVEANGSVVIAGKATPKAKLDVLNGATMLGSGQASDAGDFVIVLDTPLKPGDYQITIRATNPDGSVVPSAQTAVVSIPSDPKGSVLAMVEEPGKPSEIITAPQPAAAASATGETPKPDAVASAGDPAKPAEPATPAPAPEVTQPVAPALDVAVEAVEIEGSKIFVAGRAPSGSTIRVYANDALIGETKASAANRFLVEAKHDLAVGKYMVRADLIGSDGAQVVARAAVPFEREPGENVAAVAAPPAADTDAQAPVDTATAVVPPATTPPASPTEAASPPAAAASEPAPAAASGATNEPPKAAVAASEPPMTAAQTPPTATTPADTANPVVAAPADTSAASPPTMAAATPGVDATAPALTNVDSAVIIRRGDSLWRISKRVYGRGVRYSTIYLANQDQISDPNRIWPGQVFSVPSKTGEGEAADMTRIGGQATTKTP